MKNKYLRAFLLIVILGIFPSCASRAPLTSDPINPSDGFSPSYVDINTNIEFLHIPAGSFTMGSPDDEKGRDMDEGPVHHVSLDEFYMGKYEITQAQWENVMGHSFEGSPDLPVVDVSWHNVQDFIKQLNKKSNIQYRLPTEAEWEYACRAGSQAAFSSGPDELVLKSYAWFSADSGGERHLAGSKKPNDLGLYDMHGNVCEWVGDGRRGYRAREEKNPVGPPSPKKAIHRGGCWLYPAELCRSANRNTTEKKYFSHIIGFRLVFDKKDLDQPSP